MLTRRCLRKISNQILKDLQKSRKDLEVEEDDEEVMDAKVDSMGGFQVVGKMESHKKQQEGQEMWMA